MISGDDPDERKGNAFKQSLEYLDQFLETNRCRGGDGDVDDDDDDGDDDYDDDDYNNNGDDDDDNDDDDYDKDIRDYYFDYFDYDNSSVMWRETI